MTDRTIFQPDISLRRLEGIWGELPDGVAITNHHIRESDELPQLGVDGFMVDNKKWAFFRGNTKNEVSDGIAAELREAGYGQFFKREAVVDHAAMQRAWPTEYTASMAQREIEALTARVEALEADARPVRKAS